MQTVVVENLEKGIEKATDVLYENVDKKTILFLSGGNTPKPLYKKLSDEKIIHPAGVAMVDERFGAKWHGKSNELMISKTGLLNYLKAEHIPFHPIISSNPTDRISLHLQMSREELANAYDKTVRDLFFQFPKSVAIMGIGSDGHTSSIIPIRNDFTNPMFDIKNQQKFVSDFDDKNSNYSERIGLTFAGLRIINFFIVLIFGDDKKEALEKMFSQGSIEEIPARFFTKEASGKTLVITDRKV